jgi:hypothetical protein
VTDLVSTLDYGTLQDDAARVIRNLTSIEREIALHDRDTTRLHAYWSGEKDETGAEPDRT